MVDAATATLFANAVNGNHFTTAVIQISSDGASTLCFLEYTLEDVVVTSVVPGVVESLSLSFGRLTQKFIAVNSNGTPSPPCPASSIWPSGRHRTTEHPEYPR